MPLAALEERVRPRRLPQRAAPAVRAATERAGGAAVRFAGGALGEEDWASGGMLLLSAALQLEDDAAGALPVQEEELSLSDLDEDEDDDEEGDEDDGSTPQRASAQPPQVRSSVHAQPQRHPDALCGCLTPAPAAA